MSANPLVQEMREELEAVRMEAGVKSVRALAAAIDDAPEGSHIIFWRFESGATDWPSDIHALVAAYAIGTKVEPSVVWNRIGRRWALWAMSQGEQS